MGQDMASGLSDREYVLNGGLCCPYCGSRSVDARCAPVVETREAWQDVHCCACGRHWRDWYDLAGYEDLPTEARRAA